LLTLPGAASAICASLLSGTDMALADRADFHTIRMEIESITAARMVDTLRQFDAVFMKMHLRNRITAWKFERYT
jgi:hypothetical protein